MRRDQRRLHHRAWMLLGPALLLGAVLALLWRPPLPIQNADSNQTASTSANSPVASRP